MLHHAVVGGRDQTQGSKDERRNALSLPFEVSFEVYFVFFLDAVKSLVSVARAKESDSFPQLHLGAETKNVNSIFILVFILRSLPPRNIWGSRVTRETE